MHIARSIFSIVLGACAVTGLNAQAETKRTPQAVPAQRLDADHVNGSLIGIQYENYFTEGAGSWETAEGIPILGKYSSYDASILKKHFEWFRQLGIDWLLIDWSNMLWMKPAWEEHTGATHELERSVALMFQTALELQKQGKYAPKMVFMLGLLNGPPTPNKVQRLNEIIHWLDSNYLDKPEYRNLWLYYGGKPLLTILYFPADPCKQLPEDLAKTSLHAPGWTVRWMASQLQANHAERCGMWSWMDGDIQQKVTRRDGKAEETVVTPAAFPGKGWLAPDATGRDHGAPYIDSWKVAFADRPKSIQIHQWNEFMGAKEGTTSIYGDEYNLEFSDDLEPTQLKACAYRGCGGWGYYYMNLTRAIISLYRGETPGITVMALSGPVWQATVKQKHLQLHWSVLGKEPTSYSILLDGHTVATNLTGTTYNCDLSGLAPGTHHLRLLAAGAHTYFDLDPNRIAIRSVRPLPVTSEVEFKTVSR